MGFYSDLKAAGNTDGFHCFDGIAYSDIPVNWVIEKLGDENDGERIRITRGAAVVTFLLHRNGRIGARDLTRDVITLSIAQLARLPDVLQAAFRARERVPGGRRQ